MSRTPEPKRPPTLFERAQALEEGEGELDRWVERGFTLQEFVNAKQRLAADRVRQRQIDTQPDPAAAKEDEAFQREVRDCLPLRINLPIGVSVEAFRSKIHPFLFQARAFQGVRAIKVVHEVDLELGATERRREKQYVVDVYMTPTAPQPETQWAISRALGELTGATEKAEKDERTAAETEKWERQIREEQAAVFAEISIW